MNRPRSIGLTLLVLFTVVFAAPRFVHGWHSLAGEWRNAFALVALGCTSLFVYGMAARIVYWTSGRADSRAVGAAGALTRFLALALLQQRVLRRPIGVVHALMFWGFGSLFVIFSLPLLGLDKAIVPAFIYVTFNLALVAGGVTLAGRLLLVTRKLRHLTPVETGSRLLAPMLIAAIGVSYFFAARGVLFEFVNLSLVAIFFAAIPYTRLLHTLAVPIWLSVRPDERLALPAPFNLAHQSEQDAVACGLPLGPRERQDFSCSSLVGFDACTRCGRCEDACPAITNGTTFSPAEVMKELQQTNDRNSRVPLTSLAHALEVDACTTCGHCEEVCPVGLEPITVVLQLRRSLAYEGEFEPGHNDALRRLASHGVVWDAERNLPVDLPGPVPWPPDPGAEPPELIYWLGCSGRHEPRSQQIAKTVAGLLDRAGVRWTCAGDAEICTGDPARRLGDEGLFQRHALKVIALLKQARTNTILVNCAHCFNSIGKEYRNFGAQFDVVHHSEFLGRLVQTGRLGKLEALPRKVAFHDPCYLGRHNRCFDAPRDLLGRIAGLSTVELSEMREHARCCGAGGGRMWRETEPGAAMAQLRAEQVAASGADALVTGCPFCMAMLEDPVSSGGMVTRDIAEIIADAMRE
ncbi:MAG: heterodisulfide reductase-related iron-sulfur binding cluster [Gammaproteobacteria bacterium]|jgi:Fe-S oxidoreductase|nr:heterodisulfide reductase-related iron-sulfur binding cluster [Gammaproteobacteria bacterium]HJP34360.1 heterodisulfide reductase-related iron-sulfur binding cluster [Gammaproteobacteria bacterium]